MAELCFFPSFKGCLLTSLVFCLLSVANVPLVLVQVFGVTISKTFPVKFNAETPRYFSNQSCGIALSLVTIVSSASC